MQDRVSPAGASATVVALLLAAGESRRMGQPKPLLPWLGTTLVAYQVEQLALAGAHQVIVVLGHEPDRVQAALDGLPGVRTVLNPLYREGRASSIRSGVEALPEAAETILLLSVDQPRRAKTLRAVLEAHQRGTSLITVPAFGGRRGHPPMLSGSLRPELSGIVEERQGLREVMRRHLPETLVVPQRSPEVLLDLNTPEDYRRALEFFENLASDTTVP